MAMRVADLYVQMETRGNMLRDMTEAERRLGQINQQAQTTDRTLQGMGGNAQLNRNLQQSQQEMRGLGQQAQRTDRELNQMRVNDVLRRDLQNLQREVEQLRRGARQAGQEMDGLGNSMGSEGGASTGGGFLAGFTGKIKGLGGKGGPIAMALVGVAAVGLGAGALLAKAIGDGMQQEVERDKLQARFGLDEATMTRIGRAAADSYTQAFGESVNGQTEVIAQGIQRKLIPSDATNAEMTAFANQVDTVNSILGGETESTLKAVNALIKNGLAKNAAEAFDLISNTATKNQQSVDDLTDSISEYSNGWKNAGFSGKFALSLINQSLENGVDNTDRAADAIREFGRRMSEEPDKIKEAIGDLNLPVDDLFNKLKKGGPEGEAAFDQVFDAIREIEDPLKRAAAAQVLLGDTAGDFINAFTQWDPSKAVADFGEVSGAAQKAADVMSGNAATQIESAKRSIEISMDGVKNSIAQAFGPTLEKVAVWISEHKPEITAFFVALADACLATGQAVALFVSGVLRYFSIMSRASAETIGRMLENLGSLSSGLGSVIKHIPGMEDAGNALESAGSAMSSYRGKMTDLSATLDDWADKVDQGNTKLGEIRTSLLETGAQTVAAQEVFRALGDQVIAIPDDKTIKVTDNSPEARARFAELGIKIEAIPGTKDFKLVANTAEGQTRIDDFIKENTGREIQMYARVQAGIDNPAVRAGAAPFSPESGYVHYADGGIREPGISDKAIMWGEAGPEAYIPLGVDKRQRSEALLADVANRFGMQVTRMANGGITSTDALSAKARGIEGAKYVFGGWDDSWNTDCTGAQSRMANLIVYGDPMVGGRFATGNEESALAARGFKSGTAPAGIPAYEIGWLNDPSGPGGGHSAGTLFDAKGNGTNVEMGGARGNGQFGGSAAGSRNFKNIMYYPLSTSVGAGTGTDSNAGGAAPGSRAGSSALTGAGGAVPVEVVNWPQDKAKSRLSIATFNNGGTVGGVGNSDTEAALLTPGEEVTRAPMAQKYRGLLKAIASDNVAGYALGGTVGSGFGGGYSSSPDPAKRLSLYEIAGLAAGLGFTIASGVNGQGQYQGFNTGNTSIPGLEDALKALAEKIQPQPAVVVEHAEVKADNPRELLDSLGAINPALAQITQRGLV